VPTRTNPRSSVSHARCFRRPARQGWSSGRTKWAVRSTDSTVAEHHASRAVAFDDRPANLAVDDTDAARFELLAALRSSA
jgi:hypothetical protein